MQKVALVQFLIAAHDICCTYEENKHYCKYSLSLYWLTFLGGVHLNVFIYLFSHLADAFVQSDLQMRAIEAIKTNKRATTCKCYDKSWLA